MYMIANVIIMGPINNRLVAWRTWLSDTRVYLT